MKAGLFCEVFTREKEDCSGECSGGGCFTHDGLDPAVPQFLCSLCEFLLPGRIADVSGVGFHPRCGELGTEVLGAEGAGGPAVVVPGQEVAGGEGRFVLDGAALNGGEV